MPPQTKLPWEAISSFTYGHIIIYYAVVHVLGTFQTRGLLQDLILKGKEQAVGDGRDAT